MKLKFWGVRGSLPTPGPATVKYGGNTSCFEVIGAQGECIVLDAGTGIRLLGLDMIKRGKLPSPIHLFISHTHWDHIQGFPFFPPCYIQGTQLEVKGPAHFDENKSLRSIFDLQMSYEYFPVSNEQLAAQIVYDAIGESEFDVGGVHFQTQFVNHPVRTLGFRLTENGRTLVYTGDHEPYRNLFHKKSPSKIRTEDEVIHGDVDRMVAEANQRFVRFISNANTLIVDCQYTPEEYVSKKGWGHSSWEHCLEWMRDGKVERMILTHHDPLHNDQMLDEMLAATRKAAPKYGVDPEKITMATEGVELTV